MRPVKKHMKDMHFTRKELLEMARDKNRKLPRHLKDCPECRQEWELLQAFPVAGQLPLPDAPSGWIEKAVALGKKDRLLGKLKTLIAELTFDSWKIPQPVGVRGDALQDQRRLRFQADKIGVDIRAEHADEGWVFVGQLSGVEIGEAVLKVGKRTVQPDPHGFYQWSSKTPPGEIFLQAGEASIKLPKIKWTKSKPR